MCKPFLVDNEESNSSQVRELKGIHKRRMKGHCGKNRQVQAGYKRIVTATEQRR